MKTPVVFPIVAGALILNLSMLIETPAGVQRVRYELCDAHHNCRIVEQTVNYPVCDEHHNCKIINAFESGKAKIWEEEELVRRGAFVFSLPEYL